MSARWGFDMKAGEMSLDFDERAVFGCGVPANTESFEILVVGASFGGPKAIESVLCGFSSPLNVPVVVCQHITPGMTGIWAESLSSRCGLKAVEATSRSRLEPGVVHIAPAGLQMRVYKGALGPTARLDEDFADSLHVPSIDVLFSSAAQAFGSATLAVLLTGLGSDGSAGMAQVRTAGGYTIGESEHTAVSYSMPGSARNAGGVVEELPLTRIPKRLVELGVTC